MNSTMLINNPRWSNPGKRLLDCFIYPVQIGFGVQGKSKFDGFASLRQIDWQVRFSTALNCVAGLLVELKVSGLLGTDENELFDVLFLRQPFNSSDELSPYTGSSMMWVYGQLVDKKVSVPVGTGQAFALVLKDSVCHFINIGVDGRYGFSLARYPEGDRSVVGVVLAVDLWNELRGFITDLFEEESIDSFTVRLFNCGDSSDGHEEKFIDSKKPFMEEKNNE